MSLSDAAQSLARADWIGEPPADDWNRLTFGEQQSYRRRACRTAGAVYSITVSAKNVSVTVTLPAAMALDNLTQAEAQNIERFLHDKMEDAIVWVIAEREQRNDQR